MTTASKQNLNKIEEMLRRMAVLQLILELESKEQLHEILRWWMKGGEKAKRGNSWTWIKSKTERRMLPFHGWVQNSVMADIHSTRGRYVGEQENAEGALISCDLAGVCTPRGL